jgi:uncharacterized Zn finger protein (UPF0148 family)
METKKCPTHKIPMVRVTMTFCPACRGSATSKRKERASRENGTLGGRPVRSKDSGPRKR